MEKSKNQKNTYYIIWAVIITTAFILMFYSGLPGYGNDDFFLGLIPSGVFGDFSPYNIHNNIVWGFVLSVISRFLPGTNWTFIFYISGIFISFMFLGFLYIRKYAAWGIILGISVFLSGLSLIYNMNYSKTAVIIAMTGFSIVAYVLKEGDLQERKAKFQVIAGIFLGISGSLLRYKSSIAMAGFVFLFIIYSSFILKPREGHNTDMEPNGSESGGLVKVIKKLPLIRHFLGYKIMLIRSRLYVWLGILLAIGMFWGIDYGVYHFEPEWKEFKSFNDYREKVMDYYIPDFEEGQSEYQALGLGKEQVELFSQWKFADDNFFNSDILKGIKKIQNKVQGKNISFSLIKYLLLDLYRGCKDIPAFYLMIIVAITFCIGQNRFLCMLAALGGFIELLALVYNGRYPERALIVPILASIIFITIVTDRKTDTKLFRIVVSLCISATLILNIRLFLRPDFVAGKNRNSYSIGAFSYDQEVNNYIREINGEDKLYIWDVVTAAQLWPLGMKNIGGLDTGLLHNSCLAGGWLVPSPDQGNIVENFTKDKEYRHNVFKLLAENEKACYVTESEQESLLLNHIREYNPKAEMRIVDNRIIAGKKLYIMSFYVESEDNMDKKEWFFEKPNQEEIKENLTELQYEVTQNAATEQPFNNEFWDFYEKGLYVDIVTGEPLFTSEEKYPSSCGWPAFYESINDDLQYLEDKSHGMYRTEVRSAIGDSHLGHVFQGDPESPSKKRYCINSASLRFIPYEELEDEGYGFALEYFLPDSSF